jgi:hypothetical protein
MVRDHEAVLTQEVSKSEGTSEVLVFGSAPVTEVHGAGVIDHVRNQKPDIFSGEPVPESIEMVYEIIMVVSYEAKPFSNVFPSALYLTSSFYPQMFLH